MSTGLTTKVRVVKCPRCRQLLPELADFPLYKCGGCGAVLQAKSRKNEGKADSGGNYLKRVSSVKLCSSSPRNAAGECSLDQSNESDGCNRQQPAGVNFCIEVPSSTELVCLDKEESSSPAREGKEICAKSPDFTTLTTNGLSGATDMSSTIAAEGSIHVDLTSRNLKPFPYENVNQSERNDNLGFNRMSSTDTLETTESANISCESGLMQKNMFKSPTTRSFYGYEGSVSSFDGNDNDVPDHFSRLSLCDNGMNFVGDGKSRIRDDFWQSTMSGSSEVQHIGKRALQIPSSQRQHVIKQSNWNQDELEEPMRRESLARRWRSKLERDEIASDRTSRGDGYVNGCPSGQGQGLGVFERRSSFLAEEDKLKLFRMVHEIRDKLDRAYPQKGYRNGKIPNITAWKENQIPVDYNHPRSKEEIYQGFDYTVYPPRSGRCWCRQCTFFGVPFSGEVTRNERSDHHVDCSSCLCYYNQDWRYSTQLNTGKSYNSRISMPLSPNSEDQKEATREKHQVAKRHFQPIAGGAPFIICKCCRKMLHLPADFLLFRRRCHRLKCSACSEILKFSLRNRTHIVPYTPKDVDPPPSEVDDIYDTRNISVYANENNSQPVSLSCSENYGPSICKSCSTDEAPFEVRKKNLLGKESSCLHEPAVNSIKLSKTEKQSSEIEELQPRTGMPLHRLWGYSSPSEVINGSVARN